MPIMENLGNTEQLKKEVKIVYHLPTIVSIWCLAASLFPIYLSIYYIYILILNYKTFQTYKSSTKETYVQSDIPLSVQHSV